MSNKTKAFLIIMSGIILDRAFDSTNSNPPLTAEDFAVSIQDDDDALKDTLTMMATSCFVPLTPGIDLLLGRNFTNDGQGVDLTTESVMRFEPA